jgi:hypothetical protein
VKKKAKEPLARDPSHRFVLIPGGAYGADWRTGRTEHARSKVCPTCSRWFSSQTKLFVSFVFVILLRTLLGYILEFTRSTYTLAKKD